MQITSREDKNAQIAAKVIKLYREGGYKSLFTYVSFGSEADTHNIIKALISQTAIYVPITKDKMYLTRLNSAESLTADKRGNLNTLASNKKIEFYSGQADMAIIPMLGFNKKLFRIGYGGGYYDKYLKDFSGVKVGIAYDEQYSEFKNEQFDVGLDIIITPTKILIK